MDMQNLCEKFERMGARLKIGRLAQRRWKSTRPEASINVLHDRKGEYFDLKLDPSRNFKVDALDIRPKDRHLLLGIVKDGRGSSRGAEKQKFLCGHDERSWFVAAVPGQSASTVTTAMEALKPPGARESQARHRVKAAHRNHRKNRGFIRQGKWFFIPCPDMNVNASYVLRNEPLQRTGGKAHWAEFAFRTGGQTVYVSRLYPSGLTPEQFERQFGNAGAARSGFRLMRRDVTAFVKGRISHPDHKTIILRCWHRVEMSTENQAAAMRHVAFLD